MKLLINAVVELFIAVLRKMVYQRNEKNVESFCIHFALIVILFVQTSHNFRSFFIFSLIHFLEHVAINIHSDAHFRVT